VDYSFSMLLGGGTLIVLEAPFTLLRGASKVLVPPADEVFEVAEALPLFNARIKSIRARASGDLRIEFDGHAVAAVPVDPNYENWQIFASDGEAWIGTAGGGLSHIAAT